MFQNISFHGKGFKTFQFLKTYSQSYKFDFIENIWNTPHG